MNPNTVQHAGAPRVELSSLDFISIAAALARALASLGGSPWCKPPSLDVASLGGGSIRREAFQAGGYPPASQPTVFRR